MPSDRREAARELRNVVECFWLASRDFSTEGPFLVTPDGFVELLIFNAPVWAEFKSGRHRLPDCVLLGPLTGPLNLVANSLVCCAGIRLKMWAMGRLCRSRQEKRPWSDASALAADMQSKILAALRESRLKDAFLLLEELAKQLLRSEAETDQIEQCMADDVADVSATVLAKKLHLGERQAARRFKKATRLSPKQFSGVVRFQFVRDRLWLAPRTSLTMLALDAGYADQAHLTREFKRYAGVTPTTFARQLHRKQTAAKTQTVL